MRDESSTAKARGGNGLSAVFTRKVSASVSSNRRQLGGLSLLPRVPAALGEDFMGSNTSPILKNLGIDWE